MTPDPLRLLEPVRAIARAAGEAILAIYDSPFEVATKADRTPVTAADHAAHALIARELALLTPQIPVWSEESATEDFALRSGWRWFWLVDPLDGTREFIQRNGEFTVNIALIDTHRPVLGVVHAPVLGRDYVGCVGSCAHRADGVGPLRPIAVQRSAESRVRVVGSRSHAGASLTRYLERLGPHELVSMGSSLKFCLVAEGAADIYPRFGPTSAWDTAAAQAVVEAAGGRVIDLQGVALGYNQSAEVLNPHFIALGDAGRDWLAPLATNNDDGT